MPGLRHLSPNNLPHQTTSFIGREREIVKIKRLLANTRLVTLTGAGGCGKTRLAQEVGAGLLDRFTDGVWWVEMAALTEPELVPQAISAALNVHEQPGRPLVETLGDYLRPKSLLLLLDNCEHLHTACARLVDILLSSCANLRILATSREPLGLPGETKWRVPSLSLPEHHPPSSVKHLARYEAVHLFCDRATAAEKTFALSDHNARAVAKVCTRLDGIPLAIELAAARVAVLAVDQIASRLDDRFRLLTGGSQKVPRHQTLRATMDWSYGLISETERTLLRRLSVFAGGWTLDAAEGVCAGMGLDEADMLDLLTQLVDKSLVLVETRGGEARYRLLETVRQYGRDRLAEAGETADVARRHRDWYLEWSEHIKETKLRTAEQGVWVERLRVEHDNLRAALEWSMEGGGDDPGLRLTVALAWFWYVDGHWSEGRKWLEQALSLAGDVRSETLASALLQAAYHARNQGDYEKARAFAEKGLTIARETDNKEDIAWCVYNLGVVAVHEGDYSRGKALCEEGVALGRQLNLKYLLAWDLAQLGHIARDSADYEQATRFYEESLAFAREHGEKYAIAYALRNMGVLALHVRNYERAAILFGESLALCQAAPNWVTEECLVGMAEIACTKERFERAARLFGAGDALYEWLGDRRSTHAQARYDERVAATRAGLGDAAFAKQWAEGRAMTVEQAVEHALQSNGGGVRGLKETEDAQVGKRARLLAPREREVAALVARGLSNHEIASLLVITERTAETHVQHILNKLGFNSRAQIAVWAVENGLHTVSSL